MWKACTRINKDMVLTAFHNGAFCEANGRIKLTSINGNCIEMLGAPLSSYLEVALYKFHR